MSELQSDWYVIHTYSGYENKVRDSLVKTVGNREMHDMIREIRVPVEEVIEVKNGKRHVAQRKIFPGYVLVNMVMTDETWYVVRNTRGVTGFVGPGSRPIPLTEEEIDKMQISEKRIDLDIQVGDEVSILSGALENFSGKVAEVDEKAQKIRVTVSLFGRDTLVELEFDEVKKG